MMSDPQFIGIADDEFEQWICQTVYTAHTFEEWKDGIADRDWKEARGYCIGDAVSTSYAPR